MTCNIHIEIVKLIEVEEIKTGKTVIKFFKFYDLFCMLNDLQESIQVICTTLALHKGGRGVGEMGNERTRETRQVRMTRNDFRLPFGTRSCLLVITMHAK